MPQPPLSENKRIASYEERRNLMPARDRRWDHRYVLCRQRCGLYHLWSLPFPEALAPSKHAHRCRCSISDSTPPKDSANAKIFVEPRTYFTSFRIYHAPEKRSLRQNQSASALQVYESDEIVIRDKKLPKHSDVIREILRLPKHSLHAAAFWYRAFLFRAKQASYRKLRVVPRAFAKNWNLSPSSAVFETMLRRKHRNDHSAICRRVNDNIGSELNGWKLNGERNVLSTQTKRFFAWAIFASASTSTTFSSGLLGVSIQDIAYSVWSHQGE